MEGRILGIPSVAFSAFGREDIMFADIALWCRKIVEKVLDRGMPEDTYLNVNVPNLRAEEIKGVKVTRQGKRDYREKVFRYLAPYGEPLYWIAAEEFGWRVTNYEAADGIKFLEE